MTIQMRRTRVPNHPPVGLAEGQLAVEMGTNPARLWVGVPPSIDPSGRRELLTARNFFGGELVYINPWELRFRPRRGNYIQHNGRLWQIPAAGIPLGNPGFAPHYPYLLWLIEASPGVLGFTWSYGAFHDPSHTLGNEGVEVYFDGTNRLDSHTLVGMVAVDGAGSFRDDENARFTLSWFNRRPRRLTANINATTTAQSFVVIGDSFYFLCWSNSTVYAGFAASRVAANWDDRKSWTTYQILDFVGNPISSPWHTETYQPNRFNPHVGGTHGYMTPGEGSFSVRPLGYGEMIGGNYVNNFAGQLHGWIM